MDFTAADRQVWTCWGGAKDCFEAAAKDCGLAVAKIVASSSGAKISSIATVCVTPSGSSNGTRTCIDDDVSSYLVA